MSDRRDPHDPSSEPDISAAAEQARERLHREFEGLRKDLLAQPKASAGRRRPAAETGPFLGRSGTTALALLGVIAATALGVVTGQVARNGSSPLSGRLIPFGGDDDGRGAGPLLADNRPAVAGPPAARVAFGGGISGGPGSGQGSSQLVAGELPQRGLGGSPSAPGGGGQGGSGGDGQGGGGGGPAPSPGRQAPTSPSPPSGGNGGDAGQPPSPSPSQPQPNPGPSPRPPKDGTGGKDSPTPTPPPPPGPVTSGGPPPAEESSGGKGKALGHTDIPPGHGGTPPGHGGTPPGQTKPPPGRSGK